MLGALVQGRVSLDGAATTGTALALYIALTYANQRRQFDSGAGTDEVVLLDYGKHQRRLLPLLAQNYAQFFSNDGPPRKFDGVFSGRTDTPEEREDLENSAAALKPLSTWNALSTIQEAREACGRIGLLSPRTVSSACTRTLTSTSPSKAITTSCCSWSASAC